tara:strand:+ start:2329 stop:2760 length:432 start_codon:yes stop_codon:yes gene_type:complete
MKKYITYVLYFLPFLVLFIFANCSNNKEKKVKKEQIKTLKTIEQYAKLDVCGCNEEGNNILDNSILVINKFKNKSELKKDSNSTKLIKSYAKTWTDLLNACFRKHGAQMMMELTCNDLMSIEVKKEYLYNFGIHIDLGVNLKI